MKLELTNSVEKWIGDFEKKSFYRLSSFIRFEIIEREGISYKFAIVAIASHGSPVLIDIFETKDNAFKKIQELLDL